MHTKNTLSYKLTAALLLALLLVSSLGGSRSALAAGPLTSTACTSAAGTVTCELWATTGSITLPGVTGFTTIWGYADSATGSASLPGPVLIANQGDTVTVILHNNLAVATSLRFEGQGLRPDRTGAAALGGTTTYTFTASQPGVFLYEAGPVPGAQYQAAMGMSGALIVRSATAGQAYASAASAYTDEALVVLSEIDPVLNASGTPASFDMRKFKPKYFLINGQAYSDATSSIGVAAGSSVLLRYVNAGQQAHTMTLLGMQQTFLSYAGAELPNYRKGASQLLMPGQSADAIAVVPATAAVGARFALYEAGALLTNNGSQAFGGMLAFLEVGGTLPPPTDTLGPAASSLLLSENPTDGSALVTLSATISDIGRGDAIIQAAEFCVDAPGSSCAAMSASDIAFDASSESVTATIDPSTWASGNHTIYVRGQDDNSNWGSFNTIVLILDKTGPTTSGITFNPAIANSSAVSIQATGNDSASGGGNIAAAEYFIDASPDDTIRGTAMTVNGATPIASLTGSIAAVDVANLAAGDHAISVRSQDALGNWGAFASATLKVDRTGPDTTNIATIPLATNGTTSVRVDALVTDLVSKITNAEMFIDNPNIAPGAGLAMMSKDGLFNELAEDVYQTLSQVQANALSAGPHTVYVRGKDAAGNWGTAATYTLISDKVKPTASNPSFNPNPVNAVDSTTNNTSFDLTFSADGTGSNITQAEWFEGADPGVGKGKQFAAFTAGTPINLSTPVNFVALGMTAGNHTINMRAKDAANNWSTTVSVVVNVIYPNDVFADGFESGSFSAWSATGGTLANISVVASPVQAGSNAMAAAISGGTSGYVQDGTPFQDASYHARFFVNPGSLAYTANNVATAPRTIFLGLSPTNGNVFTVQIHRTSTTGSFQVRAQVFRAGGGGGVSTTAWYTIPTLGYTAVEIDWSSATSAAFRFYTGGVLRQTFTGINTSAFKLDTVRLGPQGSWTNVSGTMYFDSFASTRRTLIGP